MCFKNLPIEFDAAGKARLRDGVSSPYALTGPSQKSFVRGAKSVGAAVAPPKLREWNIDPVTRVAGALAVYIVLDF